MKNDSQAVFQVMQWLRAEIDVICLKLAHEFLILGKMKGCAVSEAQSLHWLHCRICKSKQSTSQRNIVPAEIWRVLLLFFLAVTYRQHFTVHSVLVSAGSLLGEILIKTSSARYLTRDTR